MQHNISCGVAGSKVGEVSAGGYVGGVPASGVLLVEDRCHSLLCPRCRKQTSFLLKSRLLARFAAEDVGQIGFLTLTFDPELLGKDPRRQWEKVRDNRYVGRALRKFFAVVGRRRPYFAVRQFHKSGQLHVHVLIDGFGRIDRSVFKPVQDWCRFHFGTFHYKFIPSRVAVGYVVPYATRGGECPGWVRGLTSTRFRFTSCSKGYWGDRGDPEEEVVGPRCHAESRAPRTIGERLDSCGASSSALAMRGFGFERDESGTVVGLLGEHVERLGGVDGGVELFRSVFEEMDIEEGGDSWRARGRFSLWLSDRLYCWLSRRLAGAGAGPFILVPNERSVTESACVGVGT